MRKKRSITFIILMMVLWYMIGPPTAMAAENPVLELGVTVSLSGTLPPEPQAFQIRLAAEEMANPMPEGTVNGVYDLTVTGEGTASFPEMTFSRVGIYQYRIWQEPGTDPDAIYDPTIYLLNVFVTNTGTGGLGISLALYKEGEDEKSPAVEFNNRYADPAYVRFMAQKLLDGEVPMDGRFTFILSDASGNPLQVKQNQADEVLFDEIVLREIGTMTFYIREMVGSEILITYDPAVYKLTVQVTKDDQGNYHAVTQIQKDNVPFADTPIFNNKTVEGELPNTGEAQTSLPIIGAIILLGGLALSLNRKKT